MRRRAFLSIGLLCWAATACALSLRATAGEAQRVGVLMSLAETDRGAQTRVEAIRQRLQELGWIDGKNIRIDFRWSGGDASRAAVLASELVALRPDTVVSVSTVNTAALLNITRAIPIVMVSVGDPVASGFVASLAHPGGNVTGITNYESSIGGKWLELLVQMVPRLARVAVIYNPDTLIGPTYVPSIQAAAKVFSVESTVVPIHQTAEIESAISVLARAPNSGVIVPPDPFMITHRNLFIDWAARYRLPAVYPFSYCAVDGGLLSYGVDVIDQFRQAAIYVDRILKGAKPADLPVEHPAKFELVVNLRAARALEFPVPRALLARADDVID